jgi:hypothetical protein
MSFWHQRGAAIGLRSLVLFGGQCDAGYSSFRARVVARRDCRLFGDRGGSTVPGLGARRLWSLGEAGLTVNWTATLGGPVHSAPAVDGVGHIVVVGDDTGAVTAFSNGGGLRGRARR